MGAFNNYFDFAFYHTLVPDYLANNIYAITGTGKVYYDDGTGVKTFTSEEKALQHLLQTLDISGHYRFFDVYYDVQPSVDGKMKYTNYMCLITRKTNKTKNQIYGFLINPNMGSYDGKLVPDEEFVDNITKDTPFNSVDKDLSHVCGMELDLLTQSELNVDDKVLYDVRDNFIINEIVPLTKNENKITCNILFNHIKQAVTLTTTYINAEDKTQIHPDVVLVDVTGSYIKSTGLFNEENPIVVNDSLDIYREFIGGTTKTEEDFDEGDLTPDDTDIKNDSDYT